MVSRPKYSLKSRPLIITFPLPFKKRTLAVENVVEQKDKVSAQLRQNLQQALLSKELKRLRDSASIEVINPVFRTPDA